MNLGSPASFVPQVCSKTRTPLLPERCMPDHTCTSMEGLSAVEPEFWSGTGTTLFRTGDVQGLRFDCHRREMSPAGCVGSLGRHRKGALEAGSGRTFSWPPLPAAPWLHVPWARAEFRRCCLWGKEGAGKGTVLLPIRLKQYLPSTNGSVNYIVNHEP